jgi:hypothetical protein
MDALEVIAWGFALFLASPFVLVMGLIALSGMIYTAAFVVMIVDWIAGFIRR